MSPSPSKSSSLKRASSTSRSLLLAVANMDAALELAADSDYGLHATVFTRDIDRALHMARRLSSSHTAAPTEDS